MQFRLKIPDNPRVSPHFHLGDAGAFSNQFFLQFRIFPLTMLENRLH